jgi:hypothetical protein
MQRRTHRDSRSRIKAANRMQTLASRQDSELAVRYHCEHCRIDYYDDSRSPRCPLCEALREVHELKAALLETRNNLEQAANSNERLRIQVDTTAAIRQALELIGTEDLTFLKSVLYRHRAHRDIALKVTHNRARQPNGFIANPRGGEPEGHTCTSMGGMAIAGYVEEAINTVGPPEAMKLLSRALQSRLAVGHATPEKA